MPNYSKHEIILIRYPFTDLSGTKIRPAVIVNEKHSSTDILIVPITSKTSSLLAGEFAMKDWKNAGLNVPSVIKRGVYTLNETLVVKYIGLLRQEDVDSLTQSLRLWFGL